MESLRLPDHEAPGRRPPTGRCKAIRRPREPDQLHISSSRTRWRSTISAPGEVRFHGHEALAESYLTDDADVILTGYGTSARVARSAVDQLRAEVKAGLFRPMSLMPFPIEQLNRAVAGKKVLVVEMSNGQYMTM